MKQGCEVNAGALINEEWPFPIALLVAAMVLLLTGCASPKEADPASRHGPETLQVLAGRHHVCAVALAVIRHRKLASVNVATGCAPASTVHANSVFQAASLSKPVFAYAVLKLVAQGKLALDAPVMQYLPHGYLHRFEPMNTAP